jgi:hypothetical protein
MPTFEIKNNLGTTIWSCEAESFKDAIEMAVAQYANLRGADLRGANLRGANLQEANLQYANLQEANLQYANLWRANLQNADLFGANIQGAYLRETNLQNAKLPKFQIPQRKSLIVYKKLLCGAIATLQIASRAARTASLVGSSPEMKAEGKFGKCRTERAFVVAIEDQQGRPVKTGHSLHNPNFIYEVGKEVKPEQNYDSNIRVECANGIHFFMTKKEAEEY